MIDPEDPKSIRGPKLPNPKIQIKMKMIVGCDYCHQDFEWVGNEAEIERKKECPKCWNKK